MENIHISEAVIAEQWARFKRDYQERVELRAEIGALKDGIHDALAILAWENSLTKTEKEVHNALVNLLYHGDCMGERQNVRV